MIVQENLTINGRVFVRTYSDEGREVIGGSPAGSYVEAIDPAEYGRTYVEGDYLGSNATSEEYENALGRLGVEV